MHKRDLGALGMVCALVACGERSDELNEPFAIVAKQPLSGEMVYVDSSRDLAFFVSVEGESLEPRTTRLGLPAQPRAVVRRTGSEELLILGEGRHNQVGDLEAPPTLSRLDADHQRVVYELATAQSGLVQSEDGDVALLFGVPTNEEREMLSDPNRVHLVYLDEAPSENNPFGKTIPAPGGQITGVRLTEPLSIAGERRRLAVFSSSSGLTFWDLSHPERAPITMELVTSFGAVQIKKMVNDADNGQLYLLLEGSADVFVVSFLPASTSRDNDFWPSLNQLELGSASASDLLLMDEEGERKVLSALGNQLSVVRAKENVVTQIPVGTQIAELLAFEATSPSEDQVRRRVLAYSSQSTVVAFVDLYELEQLGSRNVELLPLGHRLARVIALPENRVLATFDDLMIGIIDLESRRFVPLTSNEALENPFVDTELGRVWVGESGLSEVGYFDYTTMAFDSLRLDSFIEQFHLVGASDQRRLVITHDEQLGALTVVDAKQPSRSRARTIRGFLASELVSE